MKSSVWLYTLLIAAVLWLGGAGVHACPACREIDSTSPAELQRAGTSFSLSVLFMLAVPMGIISGLVAYIVRTVKKLDRSS